MWWRKYTTAIPPSSNLQAPISNLQSPTLIPRDLRAKRRLVAQPEEQPAGADQRGRGAEGEQGGVAVVAVKHAAYGAGDGGGDAEEHGAEQALGRRLEAARREAARFFHAARPQRGE